MPQGKTDEPNKEMWILVIIHRRLLPVNVVADVDDAFALCYLYMSTWWNVTYDLIMIIYI